MTNKIKMKNPIISLIIPVYEVEKYISKFAHSVFSQSYHYIQYIFVNDGTKDDSINITKEILNNYYPHRKEQTVFIEQENKGLPAARYSGLAYVKGDYIYNVDPDDWLSDNAIEKIATAITKTNSDIIYFNYIKEYPKRSSRKKEKKYDISKKNDYIVDMYNHRAYGTLCNKCFKVTLYSLEKLYIPTFGYGEDCCLSLQLVGLANSLTYINEDLYHYRKGNPKAITHQSRRKRKKEYAINFLTLYEKYYKIPEHLNPIISVSDDILIQAAWYSFCYNLNLFKLYPFLSNNLKKVKIRIFSDVPIFAQIFIKIIVFFNRNFRINLFFKF